MAASDSGAHYWASSSSMIFSELPKVSEDPEVESLIARGEAVYHPDCLDNVSKDFPKNSWGI